jgi:hypothetical protein
LRKSLFILLLLVFANTVLSQKILVVENSNSLRNIKYSEGNDIIIRVEGEKDKISDEITGMTDSTLILLINGAIRIDQVDAIYRENWLIQIVRGLTLLGGVAYVSIESFNRMINHEYPVVDSGTLIISAGMVATSFALIPLRYRKINCKEKWTLRVIDPGAF